MNKKGKPEKKKEVKWAAKIGKIKSFLNPEDRSYNQALDKAEAYWKPRVEKLEEELIRREMYANNNAYKPIEKYNALLQELQSLKARKLSKKEIKQAISTAYQRWNILVKNDFDVYGYLAQAIIDTQNNKEVK